MLCQWIVNSREKIEECKEKAVYRVWNIDNPDNVVCMCSLHKDANEEINLLKIRSEKL